MIYFLFLLGCVVSYLCYKHKAHLEANGHTKTLRFILLTNALEVLFVFTAVSFLYAILSFLVRDMGTDEVTLRNLRAYERLIQSIQGWMKYLKLSPSYSLLVILLWFLLATAARWMLLERSAERIEKAHSYFGIYSKWLKRVTLVVTLLMSFTFFGSQVDSKAGSLQAHIKTMKDNHQAFYSELDQAIKSSISNEIYEHIKSSAPQKFARLISFNNRFDDELAGLVKKYKWAKESYGAESQVLKTLDETAGLREKRIVQLIEKIEKPGIIKSGTAPALDESAGLISNRRLSQLRGSLRTYSRNLAARLKPVLQTPLGKQLLPTMLAALISPDNIPAFAALADECPTFKAIFPALTKTINKDLETRANTLIDELAAKAVTQQEVNWADDVKSGVDGMLKNHAIDGREIPAEAIAKSLDSLERQQAALHPAGEELNRVLESARAKVRAENRALLTDVENRWRNLRQTLDKSPLHPSTNKFKSMRSIERLRENESELGRVKSADKRIDGLLEELRKAGSPVNDEFDDAFKGLTKEIRAVSEPIEQQKALRSTLKTLTNATSLEEAVGGAREVAVQHFPTSPLIGKFSRIYETLRPRVIRPPTIRPSIPRLPPIRPPRIPFWRRLIPRR